MEPLAIKTTQFFVRKAELETGIIVNRDNSRWNRNQVDQAPPEIIFEDYASALAFAQEEVQKAPLIEAWVFDGKQNLKQYILTGGPGKAISLESSLSVIHPKADAFPSGVLEQVRAANDLIPEINEVLAHQKAHFTLAKTFHKKLWKSKETQTIPSTNKAGKAIQPDDFHLYFQLLGIILPENETGLSILQSDLDQLFNLKERLTNHKTAFLSSLKAGIEIPTRKLTAIPFPDEVANPSKKLYDMAYQLNLQGALEDRPAKKAIGNLLHKVYRTASNSKEETKLTQKRIKATEKRIRKARRQKKTFLYDQLCLYKDFLAAYKAAENRRKAHFQAILGKLVDLINTSHLLS